MISNGTPEPRIKTSPMPLPPDRDVFRIRVQGRVEGSATINTLTYMTGSLTGTVGKVDQESLVVLFTNPNGPLDKMCAAISSDWTCENILCDVPTSPQLATLVQPTPLTDGAGPAKHNPNQSAAVMAKVTDWRGRHGRGRISLPAVPLEWITGTTITMMLAYNDLCATLGQVLDDGIRTYQPGLLSFDAGPPPTYGWVTITRFLPRQILGTVRRRKPGVGI